MDTPIITEITLEVRTNVYDMISSIGGTLGLFTGISVITFVEVFYWMCKFLEVGFDTLKDKFKSLKINSQDSAENGIDEFDMKKDSAPNGGSKVSFK